MVASYALLFCRIAIALLFALSISGKVRDVAAFRDAISDFRLLPPTWSTAAAWAFLTGELTVVLLMVIGGAGLAVGFLLAAGLLTVFSAALIMVLLRNMRVTCNCFGRTQRRISPYDVGRNSLITVCSVVGVLALVRVSQSTSGPESLLISLMAACFVALVSNLTEVIETLLRPFTA